MLDMVSKMMRVCDKINCESLLLKSGEHMAAFICSSGRPTENLLDAHIFAYCLIESARKLGVEANLVSLKSKDDPNAPSDRIYNLLRASWGLKHTTVPDPLFGRFQDFWNELKSQLKGKNEPFDWLDPPECFFYIMGEGYCGKDVLGRAMGYPIPAMPSEKWESTITMFYKPRWVPQSSKDLREPVSRLATTETLTLETFTRTLDVDYEKMADLNAKIKNILSEASHVKIIGPPIDVLGQKFSSSLEIEVKDFKPQTDDGRFTEEDRFINLPAGETFVTPTNVNGTFVADGCINLEAPLELRNPLVIRFEEGRFSPDKMLSKDRGTIERIYQHLEKMQKLLEDIKMKKSVSEEIIEEYERNFYRVGELGIGTNPRARIGKWIIESEKIYGTIHIALGSGFDPGMNTVHHEDVLSGVKSGLTLRAIVDGKEIGILERGKLVLE